MHTPAALQLHGGVMDSEFGCALDRIGECLWCLLGEIVAGMRDTTVFVRPDEADAGGRCVACREVAVGKAIECDRRHGDRGKQCQPCLELCELGRPGIVEEPVSI